VRSPVVNVFGAVCDRCGRAYLIGQFPHACLCPGCYVGAMKPAERKRVLARAGRRVA
jgi:hypothetical protein